MTAPKRLAAKGHGGKEMVKNRPGGRNTMEIWQTNNHPLGLYGEQVIVN
jgi:hypothetical protein